MIKKKTALSKKQNTPFYTEIIVKYNFYKTVKYYICQYGLGT